MQRQRASRLTLSGGRHRRYPLTWLPPFDTNKDDVRPDIEVCRRAQRTDGARGVQITRGNVLMNDQMDYLVGTPGCTASCARMEDQSMTTMEPRGRRDIVPTGEVRAAITGRFTSSAEPQTRLFWA
jgi:hypothetical protein